MEANKRINDISLKLYQNKEISKKYFEYIKENYKIEKKE